MAWKAFPREMPNDPVVTPFDQNIIPGFLGDFVSREHVLAGGAKVDAATFPGEEAILAKVGSAGAAVDATAVPVAALLGAIPSGTVLDFGGKKFARLTAQANRSAVSLAVSALATALVSGDSAYYTPPGLGKRIAAGRLVGCTRAELEGGAASGMKWGKATDSDEVVRLIAYDVDDANINDDCNLLRPGTLIKVNFLPGYSDLSSTLKALLWNTYDCTVGAPGQEVSP